jgi:hypothetical protein
MSVKWTVYDNCIAGRLVPDATVRIYEQRHGEPASLGVDNACIDFKMM